MVIIAAISNFQIHSQYFTGIKFGPNLSAIQEGKNLYVTNSIESNCRLGISSEIFLKSVLTERLSYSIEMGYEILNNKSRIDYSTKFYYLFENGKYRFNVITLKFIPKFKIIKAINLELETGIFYKKLINANFNGTYNSDYINKSINEEINWLDAGFLVGLINIQQIKGEIAFYSEINYQLSLENSSYNSLPFKNWVIAINIGIVYKLTSKKKN